jgi:CRP/FNR family transcriptional regulator
MKGRDKYIIASIFTFDEAQKNATITVQDQPGSDMFMVVQGCLMTSRRRKNLGHQIVGFLFPGDVFGVSDKSKYISNASAVVNSIIAKVDRDRLWRFSETRPSLRLSLYGALVSDLALAQDHLVVLGAMSALERVAATLIRLDKRQCSREGRCGRPLWLPMRRTDLASYLGIELPTLSRAFGRLRDQGVIKFQSTSTLLITDQPRLMRLVECG